MIEIPIVAEPSQTFTFDDGDNRWSVSIKVANNCMIGNFELNGTTLISGVRLVADQACIPYKYLALPGNFGLITNNDELPWWENFGISQFLVYQQYS